MPDQPLTTPRKRIGSLAMRDFSDDWRPKLPSGEKKKDHTAEMTLLLYEEKLEQFQETATQFFVLLRQYHTVCEEQAHASARIQTISSLALHALNMLLNQAAGLLALVGSCMTPLVAHATAERYTEAFYGHGKESSEERLNTHVRRMNELIAEDAEAMGYFIGRLVMLSENEARDIMVDIPGTIQLHKKLPEGTSEIY